MNKNKLKNIIIIFLTILIIILISFIFINKEKNKEEIKKETTTTTKKIETTSIEMKKTIEQTTNIKIISEDDLIEEIEGYYVTLNNTDDENIEYNIKKYFIKVIDFIFYDEPLNGYYFKDLKYKTKITILKYALLMDKKIENIFPNYKDTLNEKYQSIKNDIIFEYMNSLTYVCSKNEEECSKLSKEFKELKNNVSITWSNIKDAFSSKKDKYTNNIEEWYKIFKNS